jgi:hypothetical protein
MRPAATSDVDGGWRGQSPAVIDLGLGRDPSPGAGGRPRRASRQRRAAAAAGGLALVLGLLTAAGPPTPPDFRLVLVRPFPTTSVAIAGDLLLAADDDTISAYRLPSGRYAWSAPGYGVATRTAAGPVLAYESPPVAKDGLTRALSPDTGTPVWTAPGAVVPGPDGRTGWAGIAPVGARFEEGRLTPVSVQVRDLVTGRLLWSTGPDVVKVAPVDDGGHGALLLARADGRVEVRDMVTGGTRRTLTRPSQDQPRTAVALLAPGEREPRLLGFLPYAGVTECQAGVGAIACRLPGKRLGIWAYAGRGG